jgi:hypothetical protein
VIDERLIDYSIAGNWVSVCIVNILPDQEDGILTWQRDFVRESPEIIARLLDSVEMYELLSSDESPMEMVRYMMGSFVKHQLYEHAAIARDCIELFK